MGEAVVEIIMMALGALGVPFYIIIAVLGGVFFLGLCMLPITIPWMITGILHGFLYDKLYWSKIYCNILATMFFFALIGLEIKILHSLNSPLSYPVSAFLEVIKEKI